MVQPTLVEGRWLLPDDENAIVLTQSIMADEPDIALGDTVTLEIDDKNRAFVVVGVAQVFGGPSEAPAYVNLPYFSRLTADVGSCQQRTGDDRAGRVCWNRVRRWRRCKRHWMTPACG